MIQDILIPFISVGLAELGDKTQLTVLCLASKTKKHLSLLIGVMLAFLIADGLAIIFGDFITRIIPISYIKIISGIVFLVFGVITIMNSKEEDATCELRKPFMSGFTMILVSEMGDKTQIASGLFATKYNAWLVLIGVMAALTVLSLGAVYLGKFIVKRFNRKLISNIAGALFIIIGIICFF